MALKISIEINRDWPLSDCCEQKKNYESFMDVLYTRTDLFQWYIGHN